MDSLVPYMTKRVVWTDNENVFKQMFMNKIVEMSDIAVE